jgi:hypothetical protein
MAKAICRFTLGGNPPKFFAIGDEVPEEIAKEFPQFVEEKEVEVKIEKTEPKKTSVKIEDNRGVKEAPVKK